MQEQGQKAAMPAKEARPAAGGNEVKIESNPAAGSEVTLSPADIGRILDAAEEGIRKGLLADDLDRLSAVLAARGRVRRFLVAVQQARGGAGAPKLAEPGGESK